MKENFNRVRELILDGAIGELQEVSAWGTRQIPKPGYLPAAGDPPKNLHYDLWIGPTPFHPYNPDYFSGTPGMNCLQWNMYWDFGVGQIGDMGSHTMDLAWNAIDAKLPSSATGVGEPFNPEVTPVRMTSSFEHPANDWRPAITVNWYQGGDMPESPAKYVNLNDVGHGVMFHGSNGYLIAGFDTRVLVPIADRDNMTYYKPRPERKLIPAMGHFQQEWIDACKGDLKTSCDFEYSGDMIEQLVLGLVAYRHGDRIEYDGATGRITNNEAANQLLRRTYRDGWILNG
jgi:predicted dehydrogenase